MSKLFWDELPVRCADIGPEDALPDLRYISPKGYREFPSDLPEGDELYLYYQFVQTAFPYRIQDNYSRELTGNRLKAVVLENDYLKAALIPQLGGKLWSLYDKVAGKELLFSNPVARASNLAVRNAWCSGGVEWNCGIFGHTPFTCSPLFAATLKDERGNPVLRMYEFERIRGVVYQMDFSLPDDSRVLLARMRVVNPFNRATALYWWSNIAVPHVDGARVIVPASGTYMPMNDKGQYDPGRGIMTVADFPWFSNRDVSYPDNSPVSIDYFFRTDPDKRKFICQLSPEGYGLFECSTGRLKGRKIFVWGQGSGGRHWQEFLSGENQTGQYCEIQCGLAHTQSECLPMPPRAVWEWVEAYGALQCDVGKAHSTNWQTARAEAERAIDNIITNERLETLLEETRPLALKPADEILFRGTGWGALENECRRSMGKKEMCPHLDFGETSAEQAPWLSLLKEGTIGIHEEKTAPLSWMRQKEWTEMLLRSIENKDKNNWYAYLQLGCLYLVETDMLRARLYLERSIQIKRTAWALYAWSAYQMAMGKQKEAVSAVEEAYYLAPGNFSLIKAAARVLHRTRSYEKQIRFYESLQDDMKQVPRLKYFNAFALANLDRVNEAEKIMCPGRKWIEVADLQEGEVSLSELWYLIQEKRAAARGETFDREKIRPPYQLDFRMDSAE